MYKKCISWYISNSLKHPNCKLYYQQLNLKYLCDLARFWLQASWRWHDSVETCRSVIIYEIIVHLFVMVRNKNEIWSFQRSWKIWVSCPLFGNGCHLRLSINISFLKKEMGCFYETYILIHGTTGFRDKRLQGKVVGKVVSKGTLIITWQNIFQYNRFSRHDAVYMFVKASCCRLGHSLRQA